MTGSLRFRVLAAILLVALLASLLTGVLVRNQTRDAVVEAAQVDLKQEQDIFTVLLLDGLAAGSWNEIGPLVGDLSELYDTRIAITDLSGTVLADSDPSAPLPENFRTVIEPNDDFGVLLGDGPIIELPDGSTEETPFDLPEGSIEEPSVDSGLTVDEDAFLELERCALDAGVRPEVLTAEVEPTESEFRAIDACDPANFTDLEPALLYLGYRADSLVNLGSLDLTTLALSAAGIIGLAFVFAYLVAGRVSRPIRMLITATTKLGEGDLGQRVDTNAEGEVGRLGSAFNEMADRLQRSETARARMVSDVAHELRNPVGVLQGNLEAAQDHVFPLDDELIATLHDETLHLSTLLDDLQQLAMADAGELVMRKETCDLADLVANVEAAHRPAAADKGLELEAGVEKVTMPVDPTRIKQVLANLVANAIHYTDAGGRVELQLRAAGDGAVITVIDDGIGIDPADLERVFDRFWRADASRNRHTGGSGVGLSICRELVHAHGGTIGATSDPDHGTTITITLPGPP